MKLPHAILAAGALVLLAAAAFPNRPAVVATVDVSTVFTTSAAVARSTKMAKEMEDKLNAELDTLSREIKDMREELELYRAGTPAYVTQWKKIEEKIAQLGAQEEFGKLKLDAESAQMMRNIYEQMKASVAALAAEHNIDYVLVDDSIAAIEVSGMQATRQQMALRRVLFATQTFDITKEVIAHMNAALKP